MTHTVVFIKLGELKIGNFQLCDSMSDSWADTHVRCLSESMFDVCPSPCPKSEVRSPIYNSIFIFVWKFSYSGRKAAIILELNFAKL